jgi:CBS-domain-containing membrane protein
MHKNQISGIAIVDGSGALTATLSASDLSFALSEDLELIGDSIFLPVHLFLQQHSLTGAIRRPVTVTMDASVEEVVRKMAASRVHRVWVVDAEMKPLRVITPFEIFSLFQ